MNSKRDNNIALMAMMGVIIMSFSTMGRSSLQPVHPLPLMIGFVMLFSALAYGVYGELRR